MNPNIFKAYDVRALYPSEIDEQTTRLIGRGFVAYLGASAIAVSRDMRLSSPSLADAFIAGALEQGANVIDCGLMATDMMYFAVASEGLHGGAQITASHNPPQYNGIKMVRQEALPLSGDAGLGEIRDMIQTNTLPAPAATPGRRTSKDVLAPYVEHVFSFIDKSVVKPFKCVLDAGNGMGGLVAPRLFEELPCQVVSMCMEIDGRFPNHEANPLIEENRAHIVERVVKEHADVGIAWDGDADRCFFIDGTRRVHLGRFHHRAPRRGVPAEVSGREDRVRPARQPRGARRRDADGRHGDHESRRPFLHQEDHARARRDLRWRSHGPLLLPRQLLRGQRLHSRAAVAGADVEERTGRSPSCWRR